MAALRGLSSMSLAVLLGAVVAACSGSQGGPNGTAVPARTATPASARPSAPPAPSTAPSSGPGSFAASAFEPAGLKLQFEEVVGGLTAPLAVVNAHDGSNRLFVAEQGGQVRIVRDGRLEPAPFLDVSREITSGGERGLLGLAFAPGFPSAPRVFVDYTDANGDTQVLSFRISGYDANRVDPASETHVLSQKQPFANHNG